MLMERGTLLGQGKFKKISIIDEKINKYLKNNLDEITTPVCAFISFQTQEGNERCERFMMNR